MIQHEDALIPLSRNSSKMKTTITKIIYMGLSRKRNYNGSVPESVGTDVITTLVVLDLPSLYGFFREEEISLYSL